MRYYFFAPVYEVTSALLNFYLTIKSLLLLIQHACFCVQLMSANSIGTKLRAMVRVVVVDEIDRVMVPLSAYAPRKRLENRK